MKYFVLKMPELDFLNIQAMDLKFVLKSNLGQGLLHRTVVLNVTYTSTDLIKTPSPKMLKKTDSMILLSFLIEGQPT